MAAVRATAADGAFRARLWEARQQRQRRRLSRAAAVDTPPLVRAPAADPPPWTSIAMLLRRAVALWLALFSWALLRRYMSATLYADTDVAAAAVAAAAAAMSEPAAG